MGTPEINRASGVWRGDDAVAGATGGDASGIESKYLLTGLAMCGSCNGSMIVRSRDFKTKGRRYLYHCANHFLRGQTVCTNNLEAPMDVADREVLDAIKHDLLRPRVVQAALRKALEPFSRRLIRMSWPAR